MKKLALIAAAGVAALSTVGWLHAHAQAVPAGVPSLLSGTQTPQSSPTAQPAPSAPAIAPPAADIGLTPTTSTPFVPVGADPVSLQGGGVVLSAAQNLNPPINTYAAAGPYFNACDPYANAHVAHVGFTHVELLYQTDSGVPYQGDVWAYAMVPYSYPDEAWQFWFVDSSTGQCRGAAYGPGTNDPGETYAPTSSDTRVCFPETNLCGPYVPYAAARAS